MQAVKMLLCVQMRVMKAPMFVLKVAHSSVLVQIAEKPPNIGANRFHRKAGQEVHLGPLAVSALGKSR